MNSKNLLLSLLIAFGAFSLQAGQIQNAQQELDQQNQQMILDEEHAMHQYMTVMPGVAIGLFSGGSIGYLSSKIFDTMLEDAPLLRLAVIIGAKQYWEKTLRHKITKWVTEDLDVYGIPYNKEMLKSISRVTAWVGCATFLQPGMYFNMMNQ